MNSLNLRIINTHDTEAKWDKLPDFIPNKGEIIVYDIDGTIGYQRFKIGDGVTKLAELPFAINKVVESMFGIEGDTLYADAGRVTKYK